MSKNECPDAIRIVTWDVSVDGRPATAFCGLMIGDAAIPGEQGDRRVRDLVDVNARYLSSVIAMTHAVRVETSGMDANALMTNLNRLEPKR